MKRLFGIVLTAIIGCSFLFALTSCNDNPDPEQPPEKSLFEYEDIVPMSEEMKTQVLTLCYEKYVRDEYPEQTVADLKIDYDMGNRNGNYVFIFSDAREYKNDPYRWECEVVKTYTQHFMSESYEINVGYSHEDGRPMRVYNNGAVYGFAEAFKDGILSEEDMEYFLQCRWFVTEGERMQKRMDRSLENEIMECFLSDEYMDPEYYCCKYFTIIKYYLGIYSGCAVVGASEGLETDGQNNKWIIGNVVIQIDPNYPLFAYKNGQIYSLEDAYNAGLITKDDLLLIAEKANSKELPIYNKHYLC